MRKENEEIRLKYAIQGSIIKNNCMVYSDHYNDSYMFCKYPISQKVEEAHNEEK
jgi:hypothetical protein